MKAIVKVIAVLVAIFLPFILFIMLYRLSQGKEAFFGFSELLKWFDSKDFYKPIQQAVVDISYLTNTYSDWFDSWNHINNVGDWFAALGKSTLGGIGILGYPVALIYELINIFISYIVLLFDFFQYIVA